MPLSALLNHRHRRQSWRLTEEETEAQAGPRLRETEPAFEQMRFLPQLVFFII